MGAWKAVARYAYKVHRADRSKIGRIQIPVTLPIPPPHDSISGRIPKWIYPYPNQFGMRRTMADPCICHSATCPHLPQCNMSTSATCPHLQHVHICNIGTSGASPEEPDFVKIAFSVKHQVILRTETGEMISVARQTHPKRSQIKFIG